MNTRSPRQYAQCSLKSSFLNLNLFATLLFIAGRYPPSKKLYGALGVWGFEVLWSNGEREPFRYNELIPCLITVTVGDDDLDVFDKDKWYPLDLGKEILVKEDTDLYPEGERPAMLYAYFSDPSIVCLDFGDMEYEG